MNIKQIKKDAVKKILDRVIEYSDEVIDKEKEISDMWMHILEMLSWVKTEVEQLLEKPEVKEEVIKIIKDTMSNIDDTKKPKGNC